MTSTSPQTASLLGQAPRVDTPEKGFRVSRCCGAYAWKGSARPACPVCGGTMGTTTRMLRAQFTVLEGELLALAERMPGGLQADVQWERDRAREYTERADQADARLAAGEAELDETTGTVWTLREPREWERERYGDGLRRDYGERPAGLREAAAKASAKAEKYERRLARLGGPVA